MFTKCTKCNGEGTMFVAPTPTSLPYQLDICDFCHGEGEVDWLERIVGKKGKLSWDEKTEIWRKIGSRNFDKYVKLYENRMSKV